MRFTNVFNRQPKESALPIFDEAFLRRPERLSFRTVPSLRGAMLGERRSRSLRPALDFSDHRPYAPGDDLRHVDWNAYGRHEEMFVKLGEATQSVTIHVLLDCTRSMTWASNKTLGSRQDTSAATRLAAVSKWDGARRLAGALTYLGLASGERLVITPYAYKLGESFGPTQGKRQVVRLLQFLSALDAETTQPLQEAEGGLVHSLITYAKTHPAGGALVLISDLLDTASFPSDSAQLSRGPEELAEGLIHFAPPRWQVLVMHLLTQAEVQPGLEGDFDLQDVETGESLPFHFDESTLSQYRLRVRQWSANLQAACASRGATYSRVLAEWPLEQAVVPYLRRRGVVQ
jgi:uncharacterized protein (DUF58 family)